MRATREQMQQEALSRAASGQSLSNWPAILAGFTAKGILESDIRPRENVFTYHAWRALGRQVRRGEHAGRSNSGYRPISRMHRVGLSSLRIRSPCLRYAPRDLAFSSLPRTRRARRRSRGNHSR